ncbi:TrkH family potassium uptake protein [Natranaerofaba carboxydovora]|uniref:TrkH family potassium uptake protein n=1 Tax=Natranaerofaba carboxydovora TaxID=2742683 RepID=UPI001F135779|nr:TrkH family potassium uptake protein [Natranaerofaba carboxydovora]UMZ74001.1 Trk system potassium uptake protein TrkH [Natranaerofaba carboxydovora]
MRTNVIVNMLGTVLIYLGISMLIPLAWAVYDSGKDINAFIITIVLTIITGYIMRIITKSEYEISIKESFAFVTLTWILAAFFGSFPFLLSGVLENFFDAYFETMSGFTTTGASVFDGVEDLPRGILMWRSLTQWLGGMGIIALFVALFPRIGVRGMHLLKAEVPGPVTEKVVPRVANTAKILWKIYVSFSLLQLILLLLVGLTFFDALAHTFTTMPTGGFSTQDLSVAGFQNPAAEMIVLFFMIIAGGNFAIYFSMVRGNYKSFLRNEEFRFYLMGLFALILIASFYLYIEEYQEVLQAFRYGSFQVVTMVTTTGFATADYDIWAPFMRVMLFLLMFLGGCGGSTSGSIKQIRILTLFKHSIREIYKLIHPNAVLPIRLKGKVIKEEIVSGILGYVILYILIFVVSSLLISLTKVDFTTALSAVAANIGNVGPGLGMVGPTENYAFFPSWAKMLLSILMVVGRLEIYTVIVLLLPEFRTFKKRSN